MPLSRHFYSLEEVKAALWYCTARSDAIQTVFWCLELIDSGCIGEAVSILFESWVWNHISSDWILFAWNRLSSDDLHVDDIIEAAYRLSLSVRDHSLWNILSGLASQRKPDRVSPKTPVCDVKDPIELCFTRALHQKRAYTICYVSHFLCVEKWIQNALPFLADYDRLLGYKSEEWDKIMVYVRLCSMCFSKTSEYKLMYKEKVEQWNSEMGRMSRRHYSIPFGCLNETHRVKNTITYLNHIEANLIGCPFWEESLEEFATLTSKIKWNSDEAMEEWYQLYCPDDIPDEWTLSEKEKSHGTGLIKYHDNLFQAFSLYPDKHTHKQKYNELHMIIQEIKELPPILWEPVRRRFLY